MPTVADYLMERLADEGVTHCFVLPGGGAMHLVDSLARSDRVTAVPMLHEQAVGIAAEAYAQLTNGLGAALVTTGPGGTNAVTAVAAAWCDSTPCVFISGQVKTTDLARDRGVRQFGFQEIDIVSVVRPITKFAAMIDSAVDAQRIIEDALRVARTGRPGPVWIDIPLDIQASELDYPSSNIAAPCLHKEAVPVPPDSLRELVTAFESAERPIVLLGNGVRLADAVEETVGLFERFEVPMALTWKALDYLPFDHPLNAGRPGSIASYYANLAIQSADLILTIGARLDLGQLGYRHDTFGPSARIFVVDVDEAEAGKFEFASPSLPIVADAHAFVSALGRALSHAELPPRVEWLSQVQEWKARFPLPGEDDSEWTDGLSQYSVVEALSSQMMPDDILVPGSSGACSEIVMQAFRNKPGQRVFNTEGLGPMGFGIPAAIGAAVARGDRRIVTVDGDGGFAMNIQELATVAHHQLPISFFVLDNAGYGSIRATSNNYFDGRKVGCDAESGLAIPDYTKLAPAFGIATVSVETRDQLPSAVSESLGSVGPVVTVIRISPQSRTSPRVTTLRDENGKMVTSPLHVLNPPYPEIPGVRALPLGR